MASNWQLWGLVSAGSAALAVAVILAVLMSVRGGNNNNSAPAASLQTFPGSVAAASKDAIPEIALTGSWFLDGHAPFPLALTCVTSTLAVPANEGRTLFVAGGALPVARFCNTFTPADVEPAPWGLSTEGAVVAGSTGSTLGLGRARGGSRVGGGGGVGGDSYVSPFLATLAARGYGGWTFTNRLNLCAVYAGCPSAACVAWNWTPFLASEPELYVIALAPTAREPWTAAVIDVGRWLSVFPGAGHQGGALLLRTASRVSVPISPGTYVTTTTPALKAGWCLLGASAVAYQSACTFDLAGNRLGLSALAVGNIVESVQSYAF
jgi:hypothetical protein